MYLEIIFLDLVFLMSILMFQLVVGERLRVFTAFLFFLENFYYFDDLKFDRVFRSFKLNDTGK